jgi:hypothetical protein
MLFAWGSPMPEMRACSGTARCHSACRAASAAGLGQRAIGRHALGRFQDRRGLLPVMLAQLTEPLVAGLQVRGKIGGRVQPDRARSDAAANEYHAQPVRGDARDGVPFGLRERSPDLAAQFVVGQPQVGGVQGDVGSRPGRVTQGMEVQH